MNKETLFEDGICWGFECKCPNNGHCENCEIMQEYNEHCMKDDSPKWLAIHPDLQAATGRVILEARKREGMSLEEWLATNPVVPSIRDGKHCVATHYASNITVFLDAGWKRFEGDDLEAEAFQYLDDYVIDYDTMTGPYALSTYNRAEGRHKQTAEFKLAVLQAECLYIHSDAGRPIKWIEWYLKRAIQTGVEFYYTCSDGHVHVPRYPGGSDWDEANQVYYNLFGGIIASQDGAFKSTWDEKTPAMEEALPPVSSELPNWVRSTRQVEAVWYRTSQARKYSEYGHQQGVVYTPRSFKRTVKEIHPDDLHDMLSAAWVMDPYVFERSKMADLQAWFKDTKVYDVAYYAVDYEAYQYLGQLESYLGIGKEEVHLWDNPVADEYEATADLYNPTSL